MPGGKGSVFKGMLLVVGPYVVTIAVVALILVLAITILAKPYDCSTLNRAVVALWLTIAMLFFASVAVVRIVARKVILSIAGRRVVVVTYGVVMLASYVVIALGLMVAFNC